MDCSNEFVDQDLRLSMEVEHQFDDSEAARIQMMLMLHLLNKASNEASTPQHIACYAASPKPQHIACYAVYI